MVASEDMAGGLSITQEESFKLSVKIEGMADGWWEASPFRKRTQGLNDKAVKTLPLVLGEDGNVAIRASMDVNVSPSSPRSISSTAVLAGAIYTIGEPRIAQCGGVRRPSFGPDTVER